MSAPVDALAVMDELIDFEERHAEYEPRQNHEAREARAAFAELIEAVGLLTDSANPEIAGWSEAVTALARVKGA